MKLIFSIAWRYLVGKKYPGHPFDHIYFGSGPHRRYCRFTAYLVRFNGFEELISKLVNAYNPDLKVVASTGLYINSDSTQLARIKAIPGINQCSECLDESVVLFDYDGSQEAGVIKGVDKHFNEVTRIDSTIVRVNIPHDKAILFCSFGSGMFNKLSINPADPLTPVTLYAALKSKGPFSKDYATIDLYPSAVLQWEVKKTCKTLLQILKPCGIYCKGPMPFPLLKLI